MNWSIKSLVVLGMMMNAVSSYAIFRPDWERPILKADLIEFDVSGHELNQGREMSLAMNKRDGVRKPTSFTFVEEHRIFCIKAPCPQPRFTTQFKIIESQEDKCGSTHYFASEKRGAILMHEIARPLRMLEVIDHSTRLCEDYKKYRWDVRLTTPESALVSRTRNFGGNPEPVITIQ